MNIQVAQIARAGAPIARATGAVVLVHGRGATAEGMLSLANEFESETLAFLAPQAHGGSWYPNSFLAPLEANEPYLSRGLDALGNVIASVVADGIPAANIALLGFSQGGCLALEYAARNAQRFGGIIGLSAGLIGPPGVARNYQGSLNGTPVFVGCSDVDAHIPVGRVRETTAVMTALGAQTTERIYPGMGHTINADEIAIVRELLGNIGSAAKG